MQVRICRYIYVAEPVIQLVPLLAIRHQSPPAISHQSAGNISLILQLQETAYSESMSCMQCITLQRVNSTNDQTEM